MYSELKTCGLFDAGRGIGHVDLRDDNVLCLLTVELHRVHLRIEAFIVRMKIRQRDVRDRDRHQIDARVARAALRPLTPQVDLLELVRETSIVEQELACQFLKERALLALALRARTVLIQQGIQCGLRGGRGRLI